MEFCTEDNAKLSSEDDGKPYSMADDDPYDLQSQPLPPRELPPADVEDEPRTKKKKRKRRSEWSMPNIGFRLNRFNGAMVVIGGVILFFGGQEVILSSKARAEPQRIALAELIARGPGDNIYLELSGLTPSLEDSVVEYEKSRTGGGKEKFTKIWMPAIAGNALPPGNAPAGPGGMFGGRGQARALGGVQLVLYRKITSEADAMQLARRGTYRGMIINDIESLGSQERKLLNEGFPGTNWDRCYIFEVDREPASPAKKIGLLVGGAIVALAGLAWIFLGSND